MTPLETIKQQLDTLYNAQDILNALTTLADKGLSNDLISQTSLNAEFRSFVDLANKFEQEYSRVSKDLESAENILGADILPNVDKISEAYKKLVDLMQEYVDQTTSFTNIIDSSIMDVNNMLDTLKKKIEATWADVKKETQKP